MICIFKGSLWLFWEERRQESTQGDCCATVFGGQGRDGGDLHWGCGREDGKGRMKPQETEQGVTGWKCSTPAPTGNWGDALWFMNDPRLHSRASSPGFQSAWEGRENTWMRSPAIPSLMCGQRQSPPQAAHLSCHLLLLTALLSIHDSKSRFA